MERIKEEKLLLGKVIKQVEFSESDESITLIFNDDTYFYVGIYYRYECFEFDPDAEIMDYIKRDLGIISETEYAEIQEKREALKRLMAEEHERAMYERLKAKFD